MRNIRLFENYEDFLAIQEAISGSGKYVEDIFPGFVYTKDMYSGDTYAYYNGHEEEDSDYHFGDVVYLAPNGKLKSVYWSEYDESMGEKVGLIVVPTSHAADGNARMIAFENAMNGAESDGPKLSIRPNVTDGGERVLGASENYFFENKYNWYGDMLANGVLCWDIAEASRGGVGSDPYLYFINTYLTGSSSGPIQYLSSDWARSLINPMSPSEGYAYFGGGLRDLEASTKNDNVLGIGTIDTTGKYSDQGIFLGVSPYLTDGTQNPNYVEPDWVHAGGFGPKLESVEPARNGGDVLLGEASNTLKNPFADWDGYANTYKLQSWGENAAYAAMQYSTTGTNAGDWYVGAMGEMGYVAARAWAITYIMQMLNGQELFLAYPNSHYEDPEAIFTSTEVNSTGAGHNGNVLFLCRQQTGFSPVAKAGSSNEANGEEYPTDIPQFKGSDSIIFTSYLDVPATVRPMAMIKEGEIQHAPFTPRPENGGELAL